MVKIEMSDRLPANGQNQITVYSGPGSDQILTSQNTQYTLILQANVNHTGLTMWLGPQQHSGTPVWQTPLFPPGSQPSRAVMEPSGDFVVYDTSNTALWSSDTAGHPNAYVVIEDRGLLVVYDPNDLPLWASDSNGDESDSASWNSDLGTQQITPQGAGVMGVSHDKYGVFGHSKNNDAIHGQTDSDTRAGVWGECSGNGIGVYGQSNGTGAAVAGFAMGSGPAGFFKGNVEVDGTLSAATLSAAAINFNQSSIGQVSSTAFALTVVNSQNGSIWGESKGNGVGVTGKSQNSVGVWGHSDNAVGIHGETNTGDVAAIEGVNNVIGGGLAGRFVGDVEVTGDIRLTNGDCAEEFDLSTCDVVDPGAVMVLNQSGKLEQSNQAYDKKVVGIVSGAGNYRPAMILDKKSGRANNKRIPLALMGKVYCKVDATHSPIEIGDLLTTSTKKGYAMKAEDASEAFGAVIGKALGSIKEGYGMIPVLVSLQ